MIWAWPTTYATNNYCSLYSRAACIFTVSDQLRLVNEGGFYLRTASIRRNTVYLYLYLYEFALSPSEFRLATCMRLGLALSTQDFVSNLDCGASLDPSGFHLLSCKRGGGPVRMHNTVVSCWSACLRDLGIYHKVETKFRYLANLDRPDISIFDAGTLANFDLDISMAHPWAKEVFKGSSNEHVFAALKREESKRAKYSSQRLANGQAANCIPLCLNILAHGEKKQMIYFTSYLYVHVTARWSSRPTGAGELEYQFRSVTVTSFSRN